MKKQWLVFCTLIFQITCPYFILIHEQSNHGANNQGIYATDEVVHELIESVNFDNTMLNLLSDHGTLIGNGLNTFHGAWEKNNPGINTNSKVLFQIDTHSSTMS